MKTSTVFLCFILAFTSVSYGQNQTNETPITLEELNRRNVVGRLGLPLGTPVEIQAEVVAGRSLRMKAYASMYLLKVLKVNGKSMNDTPLMPFYTLGFVNVDLANEAFALYTMKHGTKVTRLNSSEIAELEKGYVGKKVRLVVYEVGCFKGIPKNLPEDAPIWQDTGFHFHTSLTVLKEIRSKSKRDRAKP